MKQATIYDFARMCRGVTPRCSKCLLNSGNNGAGITCFTFVKQYPDKANEIILKWCEEHPIKTRQSELLKIFSNTALYNGVISVCPTDFDGKFREDGLCCNYDLCTECKKAYWLAEVDENE